MGGGGVSSWDLFHVAHPSLPTTENKNVYEMNHSKTFSPLFSLTKKELHGNIGMCLYILILGWISDHKQAELVGGPICTEILFSNKREYRTRFWWQAKFRLVSTRLYYCRLAASCEVPLRYRTAVDYTWDLETWVDQVDSIANSCSPSGLSSQYLRYCNSKARQIRFLEQAKSTYSPVGAITLYWAWSV